MIRLALKGIRGYFVRFLMTAMAVTLGVAFVAGTMVLTDTLDETFTGLTGDANKGIDVYVRGAEKSKQADGQPVRARLAASLINDLYNVDGIKETYPDLVGMAILSKADGTMFKRGNSATIGMQIRENDRLQTIIEGTRPTEAGQIALDNKTADDAGYSIGDEAEVTVGQAKQKFTITGLTDSAMAVSSSLVLFSPAEAERLFAPDEKVSGFIIRGDGSKTQSELADAVRTTLPDTVAVLTGAERAEESASSVSDRLKFLTNMLYVFGAISLLVGGFIIVNTFNMVLAQRTSELALLRALGSGRGQVLGLVLFESIIIGLLGGLLGLGVGMGLAQGVGMFLRSTGLDVGDMVITPVSLGVALALGVAVTTLAALFPAMSASKVSPMSALRSTHAPKLQGLAARTRIGAATVFLGGCLLPVSHVTTNTTRNVVLGFAALLILAGVVIASAGLVKPLLGSLTFPLKYAGVVAKLARNNSLRSPRRTAITAGALMIGLTLVSAVGIVSESATASLSTVLEDGVKSDLIITGGGSGMPADVEKSVRDVDGTTNVAALNGVAMTVDKKRSIAVSATSEAIRQNINLTMDRGSLTALDEGKIVIAKDVADENKLSVGGTWKIALGEQESKEYTVGGIYSDSPVLEKQTLIAESVAQEAVPADKQVTLVLLANYAADADKTAVRSDIAAAVKEQGTISVQTRAEFASAQSAPIRQITSMIMGLLGMSVLIAALGIVNTLIMSIYERTREIGMLRAIGLERGELRRMVLMESAFTTLFGAILGAVLGLGLGILIQRTLSDSGLSVLAVPWPMLGAVVFGAAVIGVIAALLPAYRASQISVLSAISH